MGFVSNFEKLLNCNYNNNTFSRGNMYIKVWKMNTKINIQSGLHRVI